ncbi:MAG TPA: GGDEF domain-containing protein [Desulfobacteraceae bacterium]|nr:GGDEF domain-containing protein [Desulfobacteraceae bacterium]
MIWEKVVVTPTDEEWAARLENIDYAFQPIVNIHTGNTFGFEALLRCHADAGFSSVDALFDTAYEDGLLHHVDLMLREKALKKFAAFRSTYPAKLFYNLDNRMFDAMDYAPGSTMTLLDSLGYTQDDICFEISEKHKFHDNSDVAKILDIYHSQGFKIAVDDCGTGFSGLQLLYYTEPDYIKIDRFFIQNMENDPKKRLVVSTIVNFAHFMGSLVLAEGVETRAEYAQCKAIGCDMIQGYFIQRPTRNLGELKPRYSHIRELARKDRRSGRFKDRSLIANEIKYLKPVSADTDMITVVDLFRKEEDVTFFPVVNQYDEPVGIIRESAFKEYIFSKFGRQLLENPSFGKDLTRFVAKIPIADIHSSVEKLIETYTHFNNNEGLIMVDDMRYVGLLSTKALLKLINEKNLTQARNQNPLSKLPGNTMIHEYFSEALADMGHTYHLAYFDFDNFKPYNDQYGFRNGDRLILMFADLLKKAGMSENRFVGHVGGDDFFIGIKGSTRDEVEKEMRKLALNFKKNAESFYDKESMENGYIVAKGRDGVMRRMPLITVSVAVLELPARVTRQCTIEDAGNIIAMLKKEAKHSATGIASTSIVDFLKPGRQIPHNGAETIFNPNADPAAYLETVQTFIPDISNL